jgi:arginyl-tRNA synthetase
LKQQIEQLLLTAVNEFARRCAWQGLSAAAVTVERSRDPRHGDFSSNIALRLGQATERDPRELAGEIVLALAASPLVGRAEIAGRGFINIFISPQGYTRELANVLELANGYGRSSHGRSEKISLESDPGAVDQTLDVAQARRAAYYSTLANLLEATGFEVSRAAVDGGQNVCPAVRVHRGQRGAPLAGNRGQPITLGQLQAAVGEDACRFFLLHRNHRQPLDFDLQLAGLRGNANPVFHIQYAHARVASLFKQLAARGLTYDALQGLANAGQLTTDPELAVLRCMSRYPESLQQTAEARAPHILAHYLGELAHTLHAYHGAAEFIVADAKLRNARLALALGVSQVIRNGLTLLGVSSAESM